ncbi:ribosylnicotinamide kinase [Orbilia oligospora]|uniref:Ribosylnicotinamide kinase n=1 Tax=Orbilia oligospora TaxID=2813651 RepID=A0A8H8V6P5_ORBOL|nr:ribosylnicotinamide kinase [Orbilia oligospora]
MAHCIPLSRAPFPFYIRPSSSGKTSISRLLRDAFTSKSLTESPPSCMILHADDFYIPDSDLPVVELGGTGQKVQDWDCPEALNFPEFISSLRYAKEFGRLPESHKSYEVTHAVGVDESILKLVKDDDNGGGDGGKEKILELERKVVGWLKSVEKGLGRRVERVVIVDGFLIFGSGVPEELKEEFDIKLMIRTPYEKAKQRREDRAGYTTMEGFWHDPPGYFELLVWPAYVKQHSYLFRDGDMNTGILTEGALNSGLRTPAATDLTLMQTLEWAVETLDQIKLSDKGGLEA